MLARAGGSSATELFSNLNAWIARIRLCGRLRERFGHRAGHVHDRVRSRDANRTDRVALNVAPAAKHREQSAGVRPVFLSPGNPEGDPAALWRVHVAPGCIAHVTRGALRAAFGSAIWSTFGPAFGAAWAAIVLKSVWPALVAEIPGGAHRVCSAACAFIRREDRTHRARLGHAKDA